MNRHRFDVSFASRCALFLHVFVFFGERVHGGKNPWSQEEVPKHERDLEGFEARPEESYSDTPAVSPPKKKLLNSQPSLNRRLPALSTLSLSLAFSLFFSPLCSLMLSLSFSFSLFLSVSLSFSPFLSLFLALSLFLSLSLSFSLCSPFFSLFLIFFYLFSLSFSFSLFFSFSLSLFLSFSLSLYLSISLSLFLSFSLSLFLSFSLSLFLSFSLSLFPSFYLGLPKPLQVSAPLDESPRISPRPRAAPLRFHIGRRRCCPSRTPGALR